MTGPQLLQALFAVLEGVEQSARVLGQSLPGWCLLVLLILTLLTLTLPVLILLILTLLVLLILTLLVLVLPVLLV